MAARDAGLLLPKHIPNVYPIAQANTNTPSQSANAQEKPFLSKQDMTWFTYNVVTD